MANNHLFNIGVIDSSLGRGWMESEVTPTDVLIGCTSVNEQRVRLLHDPENVRKALKDINRFMTFWLELKCYE